MTITTNFDTETFLAATARVYGLAEMAIFPVWGAADGRCLCPKGADCSSAGKHPRTRNGVLDATTDVGRIDAWWAHNPNDNIGLAAGGNGLAILDVDPKSGGEESFARLADYALTKGVDLMDTMIQRTGSGGMHLVFSAPDGGIKNGANVFGTDMPGIDTRGRNGYIVAWPSVHASGDMYEWFDFLRDPTPWPELLTALIDPPKMAPPAPVRTYSASGSKERYAEAALDRELDIVASTAEGGRNHQLNTSAYNIGQLVGAGLLSEHIARDALFSAAVKAGLGQLEAVKTIQSGLTSGIRNPRVERAA